MKEGIGKEFTGITVTFLCHDGEGNVLIAKRSQNARDEHGRWEPGGGGLKFGETVEDAVAREIQEEFCTDIHDKRFLGYRDVLREQNGTPTHWVGLDFYVHVNRDAVAIGEPHKCDELRWVKLVELEEYAEPLHSQFMPFIEKHREKLI